MMTTGAHISATQWFWLLLASRSAECLLLPSDSLHAASVPDLLIVTVFHMVVLVALFWPTRRALVRGGSLAELAQVRRKGWGNVVLVLYVLLGLFVVFFDVIQFTDFTRRTAHTDFPIMLLGAGMIAAGFAASVYGIEAIGRSATIVGVTCVGLLVLLCVLAFVQADSRCFPPAVVGSVDSLLIRTVRELPRTAEIAVIGALYPYVNGKTTRSTMLFFACASLITCVVCLAATGVLGDAAERVPYPFYTAVSALPVRMDIGIVVLWLGTFFVRIALFGTVVLDSVRRLIGERWRLPSAGLAILLLIGATWWSGTVTYHTLWNVATFVYVGLLLGVCLVLPVIVRRME